MIADSSDIIARAVEIIRQRESLRAAHDRLFCDLGYNNRKVFDQFHGALGADFRWCGLEIQEALHRDAMAAQYRSDTSVEFTYGAATTFDGEIEIALDGAEDGYNPNDGSTIVTHIARDRSGARMHRAPAHDLVRYLLERSAPETRIVIKMDVEGAEYDLLPHLLSSPVRERLDLILCEFHWRRFPFPQNIKNLFATENMRTQFGMQGIGLLSWR